MTNACIRPIGLKENNAIVPCGKCPYCYKRKISEWSFRLMQESRISTSSYFITLTYSTRHIPITDRGYMGLVKKDMQLFMKRLRKLNASKLRYFAVGEYGSKRKRPHYHVLLFNAELKTISEAWRKQISKKWNRKKKRWDYQFSDIGNIKVGTVTGASVGYCLKYMHKLCKIPLHRNDDRIPQFTLMSKGLGRCYVTGNMKRWHHNDMENRMYCNLPDGKKIGMPRYYKNLIYDETQIQIIKRAIERKNIEAQKEFFNQTFKKRSKASHDELEATKFILKNHRYQTLKNDQL